MRALGPVDEPTRRAARAGIDWLVNLQNRDGGIPTFCRGWSALPFDRSGADLTAHAIQAWLAWMPELSPSQQSRVRRALARALAYLDRVQRTDGSWAPLWFGNQFAENEENLIYGTARVVVALAEARRHGLAQAETLTQRAVLWLMAAQNKDLASISLNFGTSSGFIP
jgi:squalene-hopene/tetraprenyl-beta-curcumene cyclase